MTTLLLMGLFASAASAQPFTSGASVIGGGGGASSGGQYAIAGTIGQPSAGNLSGGRYAIAGGFWGAYYAVQTPGAPTLSITLAGTSVEISWPVAGSENFTLQSTSSLAGTPVWVVEEAEPVVIADHYVIVLDAGMGNRYFRLVNTSAGL